MPDDNRHSSDEDKNPKRGGEFRVPPRTWLIWILIFGGIIMLMLFKERMDPQGEKLSQFDFQKMVDAGQIADAKINYSPQNPFLNVIEGHYYKTDAEGKRFPENDPHPVLVPFKATVRLTRSSRTNC